MCAKKEYRELCLIEDSIPIFSQDWWLDAVCGVNNWDVVLVKNDSKIIASLPYSFEGKKNLLLTQPKLTQTLGIWVKYPKNQSEYKKLSFEKKVVNDLLSQLPDFELFQQSFRHSFTNWLPFYWEGFQQTTRYTYILKHIKDTEKIYSGFASKARTDIKKAEKRLKILPGANLTDLYKLINKSYERQGVKNPTSYSFLEKVELACNKHSCGKIFIAQGENGENHAGVYLVWDKQSAYYLLGGGDPDFRNSGAHSFLIWEAIKYASKFIDDFDFEGSMVEGVERFNRGFGAVQTPYFSIYKDNRSFLRKSFKEQKGIIGTELRKMGLRS